MPREFIKELRGDAIKEAMDIYYHIDREELKKSYMACRISIIILTGKSLKNPIWHVFQNWELSK